MIEDPGFEYLREGARKYGNLYLVQEFDAFIGQITESQLAELAAVYREIAAREDSPRISRWMERCERDHDATSYDELWFSRHVGRLFCLFHNLAERGFSPFDSREATYVEERQPPDWRNLPEHLRYLVEPAQKYGIYLEETDMIQFLDQKAKAEDFEQLTATAERVRLNGDYIAILEWLEKYSMVEHREAYLVSNLFGVMDHADLDFKG